MRTLKNAAEQNRPTMPRAFADIAARLNPEPPDETPLKDFRFAT